MVHAGERNRHRENFAAFDGIRVVGADLGPHVGHAGEHQMIHFARDDVEPSAGLMVRPVMTNPCLAENLPAKAAFIFFTEEPIPKLPWVDTKTEIFFIGIKI